MVRQRSLTDPYSPEFEQFWRIYPRKVGKGGAWAVWKRIQPDERLQAVMLEAVKVCRRCPGWAVMKYIPHPETWLRQRRYDDDLAGEAPGLLAPVLACDQCGQGGPLSEFSRCRECWKRVVEVRARQGLTTRPWQAQE